MTVGDLARTMHGINASLDNQQVEYETSVVVVEGKINQTLVSILIDPGAILSYISPSTTTFRSKIRRLLPTARGFFF